LLVFYDHDGSFASRDPKDERGLQLDFADQAVSFSRTICAA
jgi:hypothetical protein